MKDFVTSRIDLKGLELELNLGWSKEERLQKQKVTVNIHIQFPHPPKACMTDNLEDTFCYDKLVSIIKDNLLKREFRLLESFCYEMYRMIKALAHDASLSVSVTKNPSLLNLTKGVSFSYGDF